MKAEEFLTDDQFFTKSLTEKEKEIFIDRIITHHQYVERMITFAKHHVEKALEEASKKADYNLKNNPCTGIDKNTILNAYNFDNIK